MTTYGSVEFWNQRYRVTANDTPCEWYHGYRDLRHLLNPAYFSARTTTSSNSNNSNTVNTMSQQVPTLVAVADTTSSRAGVGTCGSWPDAGENSLMSMSSAATVPSRATCRVLILGCGNSSFAEDMRMDGWTGRVVGVDYSEIVIAQMQHKYNIHIHQSTASYDQSSTLEQLSQPQPLSSQLPPPLEFVCADITRPLPFEDSSFDVIVCKAALDAVLCHSKAAARLVVQESVRLLARGHGVFFLVTNGNPDNRLEYLEYHSDLYHYWQAVSVQMVPRTVLPSTRTEKLSYVYICRKRLNDPGSTEEGNKENSATPIS